MRDVAVDVERAELRFGHVFVEDSLYDPDSLSQGILCPQLQQLRLNKPLFEAERHLLELLYCHAFLHEVIHILLHD